MDQLKDTLREFIVSNYLPGEALENLRDDTPLLSSGILDSLAALGLRRAHRETVRGGAGHVPTPGIEQFDRIEDIARSIGEQGAGVTPQTLPEFLEWTAARSPDATAVVDPSGRTSPMPNSTGKRTRWRDFSSQAESSAAIAWVSFFPRALRRSLLFSGS